MAAANVEYRCFVGGLAWAIDSEALEKAFSPYDEIVDSKVINDREFGRSRGFEFVTFANEKSMRDAINGMNGQDIDGRNITVNEAQNCSSGRGGFGGRREGGYNQSGGGGCGGGGYCGSRDRGYGDGASRYSRGGGGGGGDGGGGNWRD